MTAVAGLAPGRLLHAAARHRALLAGGLAAGAVAAGLTAVAPAPEPQAHVLAAARDLPGGSPLTADDVVLVALPADAVPAGALTGPADAAGRLLAAPVRAGEPLTDVRLLGPGLLGEGEDVAVPVRVADPALGALVAPGDRVDVLAADLAGAEAARTVAADVPVLAVPSAADALAEGALVVVAASPSAAARLAAAAVTARLSLVVRGR